MTTEEQFDLVILGSGSTAFAAALKARELGKTAVMTEERVIGGTCVNRGCLPSKNLIEAAKLRHDAAHPRYPGLRGRALEMDFGELVRQKDALVKDYRGQKYDSLVGGGITVEEGRAEFLDARTVRVGSKLLRGEKFLIATGSSPMLPDIEGLAEVPFMTSDLLTHGESMELKQLPKSLLVIGGGYIALELGQMFARFGVQVTMLQRSGQLLSHGYEPETGRAVAEVFAREGIEVVMNAVGESVERVDGEIHLRARVDGAVKTFRAERLLVATGRRPNVADIGLSAAGVELGAGGGVRVDEFLRTSVPHIFAAGDVIDDEQDAQMATPVGSQDGGIAAYNAFSSGPLKAVDHRVIPRAIFVDPPVAVVGLTEARAVAAGHPCWCRAVPLSLVPRAGAIRDTTGFVKMVANAKTHEVLGVTMVGNGAAEVIHEAAMAMRFRATLHDFIDLLHVYPTMSEALKIAAISRFKDPSKLSCCAE